MSDQEAGGGATITIQSTRFGELTVPAETIIEFPTGIIGFPRHQKFVMLEHKPPFSWLHSTEDAALAFVVVDGLEFGAAYQLAPPVGDRGIDLREDDEYAILVIGTVRSDPRDTTANLKAPLFVNLRNRKGVQVIYDDPRLTTRYPLWSEASKEEGGEAGEQGEKEPGKE